MDAADWLYRTATRDTFVVGSEAWERTRLRWIEVHDLQREGSEKVMWTYNMPELELGESTAMVSEVMVVKKVEEVELVRLEFEAPAPEDRRMLGRILTVHDLRAAIARR